MPLLASLEGQSWRVEIRGRLASPVTTGGEAMAVSKASGQAVLRLYPSGEGLSVANGVASHAPLLSENTEYDIYFTRASKSVAQISLPPAVLLKYDTERLCHYSINFRNDVGFVDVSVTDGK